MRLYVRDQRGNAVYLNRSFQTRRKLRESLGSRYFRVSGSDSVFSVENVYAEIDNRKASGMAAGGLLGIIGGPVSALVGAVLGGLADKTSEEKAVEYFNQSET